MDLSLQELVGRSNLGQSIRIVHGEIVSEEGQALCAGDVTTVFSVGVKVYVSPQEHASYTKFGHKNTRVRSSFFISNNELLLLRKNCKAGGLFKANSVTFGVGTNDDKVHRIDDNQFVYLEKIGKDNAIVNASNTMVTLPRCKFDEEFTPVTTLQPSELLHIQMSLANLDFLDPKVSELFAEQTGFQSIPMTEICTLAICLKQQVNKDSMQAASKSGFRQIEGVSCFDISPEDLTQVTVSCISPGIKLTPYPSFAVHAGVDREGFKLYDLMCKHKPNMPIPNGRFFNIPNYLSCLSVCHSHLTLYLIVCLSVCLSVCLLRIYETVFWEKLF